MRVNDMLHSKFLRLHFWFNPYDVKLSGAIAVRGIATLPNLT